MAALSSLPKHEIYRWEQKIFKYKPDTNLQATSHALRKTSRLYRCFLWDPRPHSQCSQTDSEFSPECAEIIQSNPLPILEELLIAGMQVNVSL